MALKTDGRWNLCKALGLNQWTKDEIKKLREALGLTQTKFAKKLKTQKTRISKWENGKESPSEFYQKKLDRLKSKIEAAEKVAVCAPKPAPTLGKSLWQSKEDLAWTKDAIQKKVDIWHQ